MDEPKKGTVADETDEETSEGEAAPPPPKPSIVDKLLSPIIWVQNGIVETCRDFKTNFKPKTIPSIMTVVLFAVLCGLGMWQLDRLDWKLEMIEMIETRQTNEPVPIHSVPKEILVWDQLNFHKVIASGNLQLVKSFKIGPRVFEEKQGSHILTPMQLDNGIILLVNRGWAPDGEKVVNPYWKNENVTVQGTVYLPEQEKGYFTPENNPRAKQWYWYDLKAMAKALGYPELAPAILYLDSDFTLQSGEKYPIGGQLNLEQRNWHLWYAITWFTLAGILFIIWVAFSWRADAPAAPQKKETDEDGEGDSSEEELNDFTPKKEIPKPEPLKEEAPKEEAVKQEQPPKTVEPVQEEAPSEKSEQSEPDSDQDKKE